MDKSRRQSASEIAVALENLRRRRAVGETTIAVLESEHAHCVLPQHFFERGLARERTEARPGVLIESWNARLKQ